MLVDVICKGHRFVSIQVEIKLVIFFYFVKIAISTKVVLIFERVDETSSGGRLYFWLDVFVVIFDCNLTGEGSCCLPAMVAKSHKGR